MKLYPEIQGPNKAPQSHCIAFYKYDGSCIRYEWTRKKGFNKFGSRKVLIDKTHPLGESIEIFMNIYSKELENIFKNYKIFRNCQNVTVYGEFFGPNSFAGWHSENDEKQIVLFDVNIYKKGFLPPREFLKMFGHLKVPLVIYEGNFGKKFIQDVKNGEYPVVEGVVAKGLLSHGKPPHNLWMAKCKTNWWIKELKIRATQEPNKYSQVLQDNLIEQKS